MSVGVLIAILALRRVWNLAASPGGVYARGEAPRRGNLIGGLGFEHVLEPEYEHLYEERRASEVRVDHDVAAEGHGR